jgi:hypothetical protein
VADFYGAIGMWKVRPYPKLLFATIGTGKSNTFSTKRKQGLHTYRDIMEQLLFGWSLKN